MKETLYIRRVWVWSQLVELVGVGLRKEGERQLMSAPSKSPLRS